MFKKITVAAVATVAAVGLTACGDNTEPESTSGTTVVGPPGTPDGHSHLKPEGYDNPDALIGNEPTSNTDGAVDAGALQPQKMWEREQSLRDGRTVTCLYVHDTGLSCDWPNVSDPVGVAK